MDGVAAAFACVFGLTEGTAKLAGLVATAALVIIFAAALHFTCVQHDRPSYRVPLFPYTPAASLLLNCFLMASLPARAYWQLGVFVAVMLVFYLLYSVHAATRSVSLLILQTPADPADLGQISAKAQCAS